MHERHRLGCVVQDRHENVAALEGRPKRRIVMALQRAQCPLAHVEVPARIIKDKHRLVAVRHFPKLGLLDKSNCDRVAGFRLVQLDLDAKAADFHIAHGDIPSRTDRFQPTAAATDSGVDADARRVPTQRRRGRRRCRRLDVLVVASSTDFVSLLLIRGQVKVLWWWTAPSFGRFALQQRRCVGNGSVVDGNLL
ncbi:hypothetical protein H310_01426 [Aphanomyces invadans]|uniref:Uncharacterized protein n=1 Tax=Aphanomyces invadans TaxID=157072 RepID=A0A024URP1_9STRA|nr:hypothetical protein H310_01426 [Aphanomyces invadans]ETW08944.1 hypothetical protein H310_01426 [Aphanomyces invadans]|eukprot:XP_008862749.1 hypothetical protein H310_01426 [Aphanomyces invadans]